MNTTTTIHDLMNQIRDYVNDSHKHYELRQNEALFSQLVSALDTVADAEEAITAFGSDDVAETMGALYLATYGLLQAFFIQQDAVRDLSEALEIEDTFTNYPMLLVIREIRNDSIGHPTKREKFKDRPVSSHQISRMTMSKKGFQLLSHFANGTRQFRDISIPTLIADQAKFIGEMLLNILNQLEAEHKAHREKYRMEKLAQIFDNQIWYAFEKASQGIYAEPDGRERWGIDYVKSTLHKFLDAVGRRDMDAADRLQDEFKYIDYAIAQTERIIDARIQQTDQPDDLCNAHIYLFYLRKQVESMREYAREIDEEYAS